MYCSTEQIGKPASLQIGRPVPRCLTSECPDSSNHLGPLKTIRTSPAWNGTKQNKESQKGHNLPFSLCLCNPDWILRDFQQNFLVIQGLFQWLQVRDNQALTYLRSVDVFVGFRTAQSEPLVESIWFWRDGRTRGRTGRFCTHCSLFDSLSLETLWEANEFTLPRKSFKENLTGFGELGRRKSPLR